MNREINFTGLTMDEIVFENRNKDYGAFVLRGAYQRLLLKALALSCGIFVLSLFTPKIVHSLGWFSEEETEQLDTHVIIHLPDPPSDQPDKPLPSTPPPPPLETPPSPTKRFMEMEATKDPVKDPVPTQDELKNNNIGSKDEKGDPNADPIIKEIVDNPGLGQDERVYTLVDQPPSFIGGEDVFHDFLTEHLIYPDEERRLDNSGVSTITFIVTKDGRVEDVKVSTSSGYLRFDREAVRVIKLCSGMFKAGKINGKAVNSICQIPITFDLLED